MSHVESQMAAAPLPGPPRGFWRAVRAEARATWWGRFRWLWIAIAVGLEAFIALSGLPVAQQSFLENPVFRALCMLAAWVPAFLTADLLSLGFRRNPEPLRPWQPWEFMARAFGRLGPYYGALAVWLATYTGRALLQGLSPAAGSTMFWDGAVTPGRFISVWYAWIAVFLASSLLYVCVAALLSALTRRPRRWILVPFLVFGGFVADCACSATIHIWGDSPTLPETMLEAIKSLSISPNLYVGYRSAGWIADLLKAAVRVNREWQFDEICWLASAAFLVYSLAPFLLCWWIASRRARAPGAQRPAPRARRQTPARDLQPSPNA